jgi:YHS domain-containing protein
MPMTQRMRFSGSALMAGGLALAVLVFSAGCGKQQPTAQQPARQAEQMPAHQHGAAQPAKTTTDATGQTKTAAVVEQTTCPVMGGAINKAIFVEYQGKKVYFCCAGCPETFQADPQKYLSKLPQFQP